LQVLDSPWWRIAKPIKDLRKTFERETTRTRDPDLGKGPASHHTARDGRDISCGVMWGKVKLLLKP
jgi:hypothetical protein